MNSIKDVNKKIALLKKIIAKVDKLLQKTNLSTNAREVLQALKDKANSELAKLTVADGMENTNLNPSDKSIMDSTNFSKDKTTLDSSYEQNINDFEDQKAGMDFSSRIYKDTKKLQEVIDFYTSYKGMVNQYIEDL